jgi:transposase
MVLSVRQAQAARMFVLGKSIEEISAKVSRSIFTVGEWFEEEDVQSRVAELQAKLAQPEKVKTAGIEAKSAEILRQALFDPDTPQSVRIRLAQYFLKVGAPSEPGQEAEDDPSLGSFSPDEIGKLGDDD